MKKKPYLLVHGAWHTGQCWHEVASILRERGHPVWTPDLPGHGINLQPFETIHLRDYVSYLQQIIHLLPEPPIVVGHSMAGAIISQVAEQTMKVSHLIYVTGFIPDRKGSLRKEVQKMEKQTLKVTISPQTHSMDLACETASLLYQGCSEEQRALSLLQKEPLLPFLEKVSLSEEKFGTIPKHYVACLQDKIISPGDQKRMALKEKCHWKALNCDHSPFFSDPQSLAFMLLLIPNAERDFDLVQEERFVK